MTIGAHHQTDRTTSPQRWPSLRPQPEPLPRAVTAGVSPKVSSTTVVAGLLGLAVAAANGLQANPALISFLPAWAQWVALSLVPPAVVAAAGYWAPAGDLYVPGDPGSQQPDPFEMSRPATAGTRSVVDPDEPAPLIDPNERPDGSGWSDWDSPEDAAYDNYPAESDDNDPYWQRPDGPSGSEMDADQNAFPADTERYSATAGDHSVTDSDSTATDPGGMGYSDWPYEGGSHEQGYPRDRR